jgi:hypothetical protein
MKFERGSEALRNRPWLEHLLGDNNFKRRLFKSEHERLRGLLRWLDEKVDFVVSRDVAKLNLHSGYFYTEVECVHPLLASTTRVLFYCVDVFVFYHLTGQPPHLDNIEVDRLRGVVEPTGSRVDSTTIMNVMRRTTDFYSWSPLANGKELIWDAVVVKTSIGARGFGTAIEKYEIYDYPAGYNYQSALSSTR